ncbi:hypothetical protein GBA63_21805 (plasmid) [Rubrobacter tropicus]|uniref:DUF4352 domain-containing protein n=1 Tax=Rubrobacter tropicus TaxID=2653851 RepID=A0A6G8QFS4_9ACTN|nr:DUF4352 domain-containing protein [Rubrobacter tropicus]QIN85354.1 hypothetical protein GBA63_21805 [Rubrobacter tropicus]
MPVSQVAPPETAAPVLAENPRGPGRLREAAGSVLLLAAVVGALAAGGWGLLSHAGVQEAAPAAMGEAVSAGDGQLVVDRFAPEHMAPMKMGGFAKHGMNMAMPQNMDMAPEGMERYTVDVTLAAGEGGDLKFSEKDFRFGGEGMAEVGPHRSTLGSGSVPAGGVVSGTINVQVPEEAENLTLSFDGGQPVALDAGGGDAEGEAGREDGGSHGH